MLTYANEKMLLGHGPLVYMYNMFNMYVTFMFAIIKWTTSSPVLEY